MMMCAWIPGVAFSRIRFEVGNIISTARASPASGKTAIPRFSTGLFSEVSKTSSAISHDNSEKALKKPRLSPAVVKML